MRSELKELLEKCAICPRNCMVNRFDGKTGYCRTDEGLNVASVCIHRGEEPVISGSYGIVNVFFSHCNLQCIYCQNHQISDNKASISSELDDNELIADEIIRLLDTGPEALGFVSPSHMVPQMISLIEGLQARGRRPVVVYNSNGYDSVATLRMIENYVDVYLPDFKYSENELAREYSSAPGYFETASAALREMYRQKGSTLIVSDKGYAQQGLVIRHLVLPGHLSNTCGVLKFIAEEISPNIHISLMSQYYPVPGVLGHKLLGRALIEEEYREAVSCFNEYGFHKGWLQGLDSTTSYRPDFVFDHPFEH
ncbi:MAG: hypothetical protein JXA03_12865 [Bacteroidales bacterium]|nr:hypothetical protein [Bacteroidales bacterium]